MDMDCLQLYPYTICGTCARLFHEMNKWKESERETGQNVMCLFNRFNDAHTGALYFKMHLFKRIFSFLLPLRVAKEREKIGKIVFMVCS